VIGDDATRTRYAMTHHVRDWVSIDPARIVWLTECFARHEADDWGDLDPADRRANRDARDLGTGRIMSVYPVPPELRHRTDGAWRSVLWVISDDIEDPDTITTVLFPSEY
jgi:hypothetical protein